MGLVAEKAFYIGFFCFKLEMSKNSAYHQKMFFTWVMCLNSLDDPFYNNVKKNLLILMWHFANYGQFKVSL